MRSLLLLLLPTLLIGCAGTPPANETQAAAAVDPTTVCDREGITGSRFQKITCRTAADRELDKRDADAMSDAARRTRPSAQPGR